MVTEVRKTGTVCKARSKWAEIGDWMYKVSLYICLLSASELSEVNQNKLQLFLVVSCFVSVCLYKVYIKLSEATTLRTLKKELSWDGLETMTPWSTTELLRWQVFYRKQRQTPVNNSSTLMHNHNYVRHEAKHHRNSGHTFFIIKIAALGGTQPMALH